jgi:uncharacterized membrane protein YgdD (TMEM256/DUF423 family)
MVFLALFSGVQGAYADGIFAKERLQKKLPSIPWQRAIIAHKDGVERLTIQSAVDADGATLGWIVPVPSSPTEIAKGSAGAVQVLSMYLKPRIIDAWQTAITKRLHYWLAGACGVWAYVMLRKKPFWIRLLLSIPILLFIAGTLLLLVLGGSRMAASTPEGGASRSGTVTVEATATVGSYDVATLKAEKAEDLRAWLSENGFSELPGEGDRIVQDYIAEGWRFVAAKLRREGEGVATPHPLMVTFPAERPIYPMRLTALSASDVYLELFIVSNEGAKSELLTRECCTGPLRASSDDGSFRASGLLFPVDHPGLKPLLWVGGRITKLAGTLRPQDMGADLTFRPTPSKPYRQVLYTHDAAVNRGITWGLRVWCAAIVLGVLVCFPIARRSSKGRWASLSVLVLVSAALAGVSGAVVFSLSPVTEVVKNPLTSAEFATRPMFELEGIAEAHDWFQDAPLDEIARVYAAHFTYTVAINRYTGRRMAIDDAPGNVTIEQDDTAVTVRTQEIDHIGASETVRLTGRLEDKHTHRNDSREWVEKLFEYPRFEAVVRDKGLPDELFVDGVTYARALKTCEDDPARFIPLFREDLRRLIDDINFERDIAFEASALGLMTRTVPPVDVNDKKAMLAFLEKIAAYQP